MPIDPNMLNPMFDPFRNMLKEVEEKNLTGPDVDKLHELMNRMEQLGQEQDDIMAFNGLIMQENLYGQFSDYYGRALASEAKAKSNEEGNDDATLLKQSIDSLKSAIDTIKKSYEESINLAKNKKTREDNSVEVAILSDPTLIIKGIQDVIDLAEQPGMTLPRFLKLQMEKGLDKAMEGSVVARNGQKYILEATVSNPTSPYHIEKETKKLEAFDELASKNKFNLPNSKELSFIHRDIDYQYANDIAVWEEITKRWESIIFDLSFWSLSYCKIAPYIIPWRNYDDPVAATIKTQKTAPGILKQKERLFQKYFGISFLDIFKHETFKWAVKYNYIPDSQEYIEFLIEKVYPQCKPFNDLPSDATKIREDYYKGNKDANPDTYKILERYKNFYDKYFGDGRYESKFGKIPPTNSGAKPWDMNTFKYA